MNTQTAADPFDMSSLAYFDGEGFPKKTNCACCGGRAKRFFQSDTLAQYLCGCGETFSKRA